MLAKNNIIVGNDNSRESIYVDYVAPSNQPDPPCNGAGDILGTDVTGVDINQNLFDSSAIFSWKAVSGLSFAAWQTAFSDGAVATDGASAELIAQTKLDVWELTAGGALDYRLKVGSVAIDTGFTLPPGYLPTDYEGSVIYNRNKGAFENQ